MGLLDDAIRDHLELKRRRGADPAEVEQAEREALGPVRRYPEGADELGYDDESAVPGGEVRLPEGDAIYDEELVAYEEEPADDTFWREPEAAEETRPAYGPDPAASAEHWAVEEEAFESPDLGVDTQPHETVSAEPSDAAAPPPHPAERRGDETAEHAVESYRGPGEPREDVLEETPEFLQDAPDHDRLWFEQKPPRDFDFDG